MWDSKYLEKNLILPIVTSSEKKFYFMKPTKTQKNVSERERGLNVYNIHFCVICKSKVISQNKATGEIKELYNNENKKFLQKKLLSNQYNYTQKVSTKNNIEKMVPPMLMKPIQMRKKVILSQIQLGIFLFCKHIIPQLTEM